MALAWCWELFNNLKSLISNLCNKSDLVQFFSLCVKLPIIKSVSIVLNKPLILNFFLISISQPISRYNKTSPSFICFNVFWIKYGFHNQYPYPLLFFKIKLECFSQKSVSLIRSISVYGKIISNNSILEACL